MAARIVLVCEPTSLPFSDRTLTLDYKGVEVLRAGCGSPRSVKAPDNAVFDCKCMSRHHARFWYESESFFIQDTKSSNGTFVNGKRLSETGNTSLPTEVFTKDIVQFGIHISDHVTQKVIQKCVIASLLCYLPTDEGGPNTLSTTRTSSNTAGTTATPNDINILNLYIQKSLHRESVLECKMAQMKRLIESSGRACQRGWKAMVHEDDLLLKIHSLEKQIDILSKKYTDDQLRNDLLELHREKFMYEKAQRESIEKRLRICGDNEIYKCPKIMVDVKQLEYVREKLTFMNWESEKDYVVEGMVDDLEQTIEVNFELNTLKEESGRLHKRLLECESEIIERMVRINSLEEEVNLINIEMKTLADEVHFSEKDLENAEMEKDLHLQKCFDIDNQLKDLDSIELASKIIQFRKNKESEEEVQKVLKEYEFVTGLIALKADSEVKVQSCTLSIECSREELVVYQGKLNTKTEDGNLMRQQINDMTKEVAAELETYETMETRSNWLKGLISEIVTKQREISVRLCDKQKHIEKLETELLKITQTKDACSEVEDEKENENAEETNEEQSSRDVEALVTIEELVRKNDSLAELNAALNEQIKQYNKEQDIKAVNVDLVQKLKDLEVFVNLLADRKSAKALQVDNQSCDGVQLADLSSEDFETKTLVGDCDFQRRFKDLEVLIAGLVDGKKQEEKERLLEEERRLLLQFIEEKEDLLEEERRRNEAMLLQLKEEKEELLEEERRRNEALMLQFKEEKEECLEEERQKNEVLLLRLKDLELANNNKNTALRNKNVLDMKDRILVDNIEELSELSEICLTDKIQDEKIMLLNGGTQEIQDQINGTPTSIQSEATLDDREVTCLNPLENNGGELTGDTRLVNLDNMNIKPLSLSDLISDAENDFRHIMQDLVLPTSVYHVTQAFDQHEPSSARTYVESSTGNLEVTNDEGIDNYTTEQALLEDVALDTKTDMVTEVLENTLLIEESCLGEELNKVRRFSDARGKVSKKMLSELEIEDLNSSTQDRFVEESGQGCQVMKELNGRLADDTVDVDGQEEKGGGEVEKMVVEDLTYNDLGETVEEGGDNLKLKVTEGKDFKPETKTVRPQRVRRRPHHLDSFTEPKDDIFKTRQKYDLPIFPKKVDYHLVDESHVSSNFKIIDETIPTSKQTKKSRTKSIKLLPKRASKSVTSVNSDSNPLQKRSSKSSNLSQKTNSSTLLKEDGFEVEKNDNSSPKSGKAQSQLDYKPSQTIQTTITVIVAFICIFIAVELFY